jgi:glycosyltransferase involved in cell wall biosynthesis
VVYPYISATQTGVMTLAYKFGVPLIASDINYFKDNVVDGKTGYLFKQNNKQDLSVILNKMLLQYDYSGMKKEQEEYFETHFSRKALMKELLLVYKN